MPRRSRRTNRAKRPKSTLLRAVSGNARRTRNRKGVKSKRSRTSSTMTQRPRSRSPASRSRSKSRSKSPVRKVRTRRAKRSSTSKRASKRRSPSPPRERPRRPDSPKKKQIRRRMDVVSDVLSASFGLKDMFKENQKGYRAVGAPQRGDKYVDASDGASYGLGKLMKTPSDYKKGLKYPKRKKNSKRGGGLW